MRLAVLLPLVAACSDHWGSSLTVTPSGGPPLGVGLVEPFSVTQDLCDGGVDGSCDPAYPSVTVEVRSGSSVAISDIAAQGLLPTSFTLIGIAEGSSTIHITGEDGAAIDQTVDTAAVASTQLTVPRDTGYAVHSPVHAFTQASMTIDQANLGAGGTAIAGEAPLQIASGGSLVTIDGDTVTAGAQTGSVQLTAALATLELDVVDASALADFTIDGLPTNELVLYTSTGITTHALLATDASSQPIIGGGPEPTFSIADPSIFAVSGGRGDGNSRELDLEPLASGNTTLQLTWGQVTKTFAISVVAR